MNSPPQTVETLQSDFDRIALLPEEKWNHNAHYHGFLLSQIPASCEHVLEIGCGTGRFSRLLAQRSRKLLAIDLSSEMIRVAREKSTQYPNIDFVLGEILEYPLPANHFDCIATLTTLHHLPLAAILKKVRLALKPGGLFINLDLYRSATPRDFVFSGIALPISAIQRLIRTGRLTAPKDVRKAYLDHDKTDAFLTLDQIEATCADTIPGSVVTRHLFWRYSICWKKRSE